MKKVLSILLAVLMLISMAPVPAVAADEPAAALSSASGASGETVKLTVSLSGFAPATSMGISVSGLPLQANGTQWVLASGEFKEFDTAESTGVWAIMGSSAVSVNGDIATLAFKVPEYTGTKSYTVTVTLQVKDDSGLLGQVTATGKVNVNNPAQSITLSSNTLALDLSVNKTANLTANVLPANTTDTVAWTSTDSTVASVSGGTVTALKPGTATVTAAVGGKSASCAVTVTCSHANAVKTGANPASCQTTGNNPYWTCGDCGKVLKEDKTTETTVEAETLAKVGHNGGTATCTNKPVCSMCSQEYGEKLPHDFDTTVWLKDDNQHWYQCKHCTEKDQAADHIFTWVTDDPATEDGPGVKHEECLCGKTRNENTPIPQLDHVHIGITHHPAVAATCVATGFVEHWTCSSHKCAGKFYGDAACQLELTTNVAPINANNHVGGTTVKDAVPANCYQGGFTGNTHCLSCDAITVPGTAIDPTGNHVADPAWQTSDSQHWHKCTTNGCTHKLQLADHGFEWVVDDPATEDKTGLKHEECSCGKKRNEGTVIDKLPHVHVGITHHPAVAATCIATGNVEYWTCSNHKCAGKYFGDAACQQELTDINVGIDSDNHVGTTRLEGYLAATCYTPGYSGDTYCNSCNALTVPGSAMNPTGNHVADPAWQTTETEHWHKCTTTGCTHKLQLAEHSYQWVVDEPATEDAPGVKHEECVCGKTKSLNTEIPQLDHVHIGITRHAAVAATCIKTGTVEYWTCSSHKCVGKYFSDAACQLELADINVNIDADNHAGQTELRDFLAATCHTPGYSGDTYCLDCGVMTKQGAPTPATEKHTPKAGYLTDENDHWQECSVCNTVIGKAAHKYTWVVDKKATESATGLKHEVCSCGKTRSENTVIEKLPHVPTKISAKDPTCTKAGRIEYFYCANCGGCYESNDGKIGDAIKWSETTIPALGHSYWEAYLGDAENHWQACACGATTTPEAHTFEIVGAKEATETTEGYTGDKICTVCKSIFTPGEKIPVIETTPTESTDGVETIGPSVPEDSDKNTAVWLIVALAVAAAAIVVVVVIKKKKA